MFRRNKELWYALAAIAVITGFYVLLDVRGGELPPAAQLAGHGLGIFGFVLMLATMTLYSLRKRSHRARWGSTSAWLKVHMFMGLVGPYMVLVHPAMRFRGLAGIAALLTVLVVISGVVGRYIYTSVPRSTEEMELEIRALDLQLATAGQATAARAAAAGTDRAAARLAATPPATAGIVAILAAPGDQAASPTVAASVPTPQLSAPLSTDQAEVALPAGARSDTHVLLRRRRRLQRRLDRLPASRRLLATWRAVHVPLTAVLFVTAIVHSVGAVYYATLLH